MIDALLVAFLILAAALGVGQVFPITSLPLLVTACGIILTWRIGHANRRVAERKLFIDLMTKRAEWYDRVRQALEGRAHERIEHAEAFLMGKNLRNPEQLVKLWQLETESGWLFSAEMVALMAAMIEADGRLYERQLAARSGEAVAAFEVSSLFSKLTDAQGKVQDYLVRYLYVGDIGKPSGSTFTKRRFWK